MKDTTFGQVFEKAMDKHGYTVKSLAEAMGVSKSYIYYIKSGQRTPQKKHRLIQISKHLNIPLQDLVELSFLG